jgi:hypothetical protein
MSIEQEQKHNSEIKKMIVGAIIASVVGLVSPLTVWMLDSRIIEVSKKVAKEEIVDAFLHEKVKREKNKISNKDGQ